MEISAVEGNYKVPEYDPVAREHFWVVFLAFALDLKDLLNDSGVDLKDENLVSTTGPGCYYCAVHFSQAASYCPGWRVEAPSDDTPPA
jgi:hypothetical protein